MREDAVQFGPGQSLVGILARPDEVDPSRPAILIPNTGLDGRVGPNRAHVHLSRALAEAGFVALRLDISGVGESDVAHADSADDLKAAMDLLAEFGLAQRFVMIGLCSGAHDAHRAAVADARVVGLYAMDGYIWPTLKFRWLWWWQRLTDGRRWRARFAKGPDGAREVSEGLVYYQQPTPEQFGADVQRFAQRGLALVYLYTGGVNHEMNYARQLADAVPAIAEHPRCELRLWPHADHTFSRAELRRQLVDDVVNWVGRQFKPGSPAN